MMEHYGRQGFFKKNAVWIVSVLAVIVFILLLWQGWDKVVNSGIDDMTTVTGNFSCLPLEDDTLPPADCELGIMSGDGLYYALDTSHIQDANTDLKVDDNIAVTGTMKPEWSIPSSEWAKFDIRGIILVNTILRTR